MSLTTTALFRDDFYLSTNEAVVTAVHQDGGIELDQTCFYATSGGQPGDSGFLERADGSRIDIRSASRLGGFDFGANARRIAAFEEEVKLLVELR